MFRLLGIYNFGESLPRELLQMAPESSRMKAVKLESRRAGPLFEELRQTWRYHCRTSREERKAENLKNRHSYTTYIVQLDKYETAQNSIQLSQNLTSDCLLI